MQVEETGGSRSAKLFLTEPEWETAVESFPDEGFRADAEAFQLAARLQGRSSVRSDAVLDICWGEFFQPTDDEVDIWFYRAQLKDVSDRDTGGKIRDVWVPTQLKRDLEDYVERHAIEPGETLFDFGRETYRQAHKRAGEIAAERTGHEAFKHYRSHDNRRFFASWLLRNDVQRETVMELGGWEDRKTLDRYAEIATKRDIYNELRSAGMLNGVDGATNIGNEELYEELQALKRRVGALERTVTSKLDRALASDDVRTSPGTITAAPTPDEPASEPAPGDSALSYECSECGEVTTAASAPRPADRGRGQILLCRECGATTPLHATRITLRN